MFHGTKTILGFLILALSLGLAFPLNLAAAPPPIPKCALPVAMTAPGQSPEYAIVNVYFTRAKIPVKSDPLLEPSELKGVKTLIIIIGGSGKGLGAAGIDMVDELARARELIKTAKSQKIVLVGMHLGGEARRGENSQQFIELITPEMVFLVVRSDGNKDGMFTDLAARKKIPLVLIEKSSELADLLPKLFQ
jgi:hypothetical protein